MRISEFSSEANQAHFSTPFVATHMETVFCHVCLIFSWSRNFYMVRLIVIISATPFRYENTIYYFA